VTESADLVLVGARVHTLDPGRPHATSLAIRDGRILAVGDRAEVLELCGATTEIIDGDGLVVVPGLVDAHCHPLWGARAMRDADLTEATDLAAACRMLAEVAARSSDEWICAHGLQREWFADAPQGSMLAEVVGDRPIFVSFRDGHGALASPEALVRAGISGPRTFGDASQIVCDRNGRPTGELREPSAMEAVRTHIPPLSAHRRLSLYRVQLDRMARLGLTGAHVMDDAPGDLDDLMTLERDADLAVRLVIAIWLQPEMDDAQIADAFCRAGRAGRRWSSGAVKFFLDGVIDQGTAWLHLPDVKGDGRHANWPDLDRYREVVGRAIAHGLGCATHAIGDRAIHEALSAYEDAGSATAHRPCRIEHVELCDPRDLGQFQRAGVIASLQPIHIAAVADDPDHVWSDRLDRTRAQFGWPHADLLRAGATVSLGSDWPVAIQDPRVGMAWARQHWAPGTTGPGYRDHQVVSAYEALVGYTRSAARAVGDYARGSIAPGMCADLTVFGADPLTSSPDEVPDLPVVMTIVDGSATYRASHV